MRHITEHEGALFEVQYSPAPQPLGPLFESVHLLGRDYLPIGPNLLQVFDKCYLETKPGEASKFLSLVADELAPPDVPHTAAS